MGKEALNFKQQALVYLRKSLGNPQASFRDGQWESIEHLLDKKRVLVVQRTGWGKSSVYFLATKLLREQGAGPTLLISPLLSLMRNQIEAAQKLGVCACTINSANTEEWGEIEQKLTKNVVDILLISPERLANDDFRQNILATMTTNTGLIVVDEAHCISDWGHDFRPDYRRIVRVLQAFPPNVPVLATTATANDRVVSDIKSQLGKNITLLRGTLTRSSLKLQNINMPSQSARLAWLAGTIPTLPGSGIVYTLTQRDADRVAEWLTINNISAKTYHSDIDSDNKEILEQELLDNKIKALVATVALGMGFDKPDLGFVIHFQRPASVVHYYQQVGRAGRAVDEAYGILLCGEEDDNIANYFIQSAFPPQQHIAAILGALDDSDDGMSVPAMQEKLNLRKSHIDKTLKFLTVESPSPIVKTDTKWRVTASASAYQIDQKYIDEITSIRHHEQSQMNDYMHSTDCLMGFLQSTLDDPSANACGKCQNCNPGGLLNVGCNEELANRAGIFLRRSYQPIRPRKQWPQSNIFQEYPLAGHKIPLEWRAEEGRALALWRDAGWGQLIVKGMHKTKSFSNVLVTACVTMLQDWAPTPFPVWVTCIPSLNNPELVPNFAQRLADALDIPFIPCVQKIKQTKQQKTMNNSYQQAKNLDGAFSVSQECMEGPCLLVDDVVDSGWTFTIASALLRKAGCTHVYPLALALNSPRMD